MTQEFSAFAAADQALIYRAAAPLHASRTEHRSRAAQRLRGLEIPIKDTTDVAGMPTTFGNKARATLATEHAPLVTNLLRQGATIPGKSLTSELGATCYAERPGEPLLESPRYPGCTPGGSSAGAGVLVGSGRYRVAHGSDAGGSLRVPAAACGAIGFKPASPTGTAQGFISQTISDQFVLYGASTPPRIAPLRIGVLFDGLFAPTALQEERAALLERAASTLGKQHHVYEITPYPASQRTFLHFSSRIKASFLHTDPLDNPYLAWLHHEASLVSEADLAEAHDHFAQLPALLREAWNADIVLSPTLAFDPPRVGYFSSLSPEESFYEQTVWSPWCSLFNATGAPAVAVGALHLGSITVDGPTLLRVATEIEALHHATAY